MYSPLIYLDQKTQDELHQYIREEVDNHNAERTQWVDYLKRWDNIYWAEPSAAASNGPIKYGATIVIPLVATAVEMMVAKIKGKLYALEQFTALTLPDTYADLTRDLEKIVDHELLTTGNLVKASEDALLEFCKFGTGIMKNGWEEVVRKAVTYDEAGNRQDRFVTIRKGLCIDPVQCSNFLMPFPSQDSNQATWCGEHHVSNPHQFYGLVKNGYLYPDAYNDLEVYFSQNLDTTGTPSANYQHNVEQKEKRIPLWPKRIEWQELWLAYDVDNDGEKEEIVVYYYRLADKIIGIRYNDRHDLSRPYFSDVYFPVEGRWAGIGLGKMGDQFQSEITTQHRQRLDAGSLANLRMYKTKRGSGVQPNEPIYYGKIWFLNDIDDLEMFQIGEVYPSAFQNEQASILHWQQRSKANEQTLGMPQVGTPGTAAGELTRVQESNSSMDYTYNRFKSLIKRVALDSMCIIGKHGVRHEAIYATINNGDDVRRFLGLDPFLIKDEIILKFDLSGQSQNKLVDRASWTQIAGILTQYFTNNLTIAQNLQDPVLSMTIARKAMTASTEAMKQFLETFDIRNLERIILTPQELMGGQQQQGIQNPAIQNGLSGIMPPSSMGFVNPINTTVGG